MGYTITHAQTNANVKNKKSKFFTHLPLIYEVKSQKITGPTFSHETFLEQRSSGWEENDSRIVIILNEKERNEILLFFSFVVLVLLFFFPAIRTLHNLIRFFFFLFFFFDSANELCKHRKIFQLHSQRENIFVCVDAEKRKHIQIKYARSY